MSNVASSPTVTNQLDKLAKRVTCERKGMVGTKVLVDGARGWGVEGGAGHTHDMPPATKFPLMIFTLSMIIFSQTEVRWIHSLLLQSYA